MTDKGKFDPAVLLLLFGLYFVLKYPTTKEATELLYGIILIGYHIRFRISSKKS